MNKLSFSGFEAFRAVAQQGSIRAAAASLQLEPSTVSHQLKAFEESLGVKLFVRTTRSVNLTEAGQVLMQSALPAMAQFLRHPFVLYLIVFITSAGAAFLFFVPQGGRETDERGCAAKRADFCWWILSLASEAASHAVQPSRGSGIASAGS